ncbi:transcriptional regulator with XRE-family HTH domain [Actinopolyspora biskrensis]|uniref:Transcriptional regulator with XRE-family HTH domain n=1 Tax=Actinopolyspora biskrensis TaxID=1470178 RepID=A0A852Z0C3_9ACTN|nr:helix-turn-helix transcriptional regulator [Actinopolyspora biskrensis]NYH78705.1 transcriptional regulator with XRE-family HTH domain [Actinopolyspora biskrensis]
MARQGDRSSEAAGTDELVTQLRRLRARSGLTLAALGERTNYSKSSWGRYLSGRTLPPYQAVLVFCRVVGADQERVLSLWEAAHRERTQRTSRWSPRSGGGFGEEAVTGGEEVPVSAPRRPPAVSIRTVDRGEGVPFAVVLGGVLLTLGAGCLLGAWVTRSRG